MPKYIQSGGKFFTVGDRNQLQQITEQDILGRRGDVPGGANLDLIRREGDIIDIDPSKLALSPNVEHSGAKPGEFVIPELQRVGFNPIIRTQAELQALGLPGRTDVPTTGALGSTIPFNQDFSQFLSETGQTFDPQTQQFSGQPGRGNLSPEFAAKIDATIGRGGQAPQQVGGQFGNRTFGRIGTQVFETTGGERRPITEKEFNEKLKAQGLNLDVLPQLGSASTPGKTEADKTFADGATTTGRLGGERDQFFKDLQDRLTKSDELVASILTAMEKSKEEKKVEKQIGDITSSFEAGLTDISGQAIPMSLIVGQSAQLERQANDRLRALNRTLENLQGDREAQSRILEKTYDLTRQSTNDAIALYKLTAPDRIAFDSDTGTVFFHNPITGEVSQKKVPGFVAKTKGGGDIEITSANKTKLLGAGFSSVEVDQIESDVQEHGIDTVLDGVDDPTQKKAIQDVYGVKEKVTKDQIRTAAFSAKPEEVTGLLRATFSDDELFDKAKEKGYARMFTGKTTDIQRFLDSRDAIELYAELLYDQYVEAGLAE